METRDERIMRESKELDAIFNVPFTFGLEAQGKIPVVQEMLSRGESWEAIGAKIGWCPKTAREHYERLVPTAGEATYRMAEEGLSVADVIQLLTRAVVSRDDARAELVSTQQANEGLRGQLAGVEKERGKIKAELAALRDKAERFECEARQAVLIAYAYRDDGHDKDWLTQQLATLQGRIRNTALLAPKVIHTTAVPIPPTIQAAIERGLELGPDAAKTDLGAAAD